MRRTRMILARRGRRSPGLRLTAGGSITIVRGARARALELRDGAVAQLGERRVRNAKVEGSIPFSSTNPPAGCQVAPAFITSPR